jgi:hypothetical protein
LIHGRNIKSSGGFKNEKDFVVSRYQYSRARGLEHCFTSAGR